MLRFWLCTGHVASPAGDWAWWFYYDRWRKYSTHRHDNLCRIHSISHRMNARILLEERPPRRAANLTQEGECDEHAEKESSRDVGGAAVIGSHRCGLYIGRFCGDRKSVVSGKSV